MPTTTQNRRSHSRYPARQARLNARLTDEQKQLLERAAALQGQSLTQFVLTSAQRAAEQTIQTHGVIILSVQDSHTIMEALRHPEPAGSKLLEAAERYKAIMGDQ